METEPFSPSRPRKYTGPSSPLIVGEDEEGKERGRLEGEMGSGGIYSKCGIRPAVRARFATEAPVGMGTAGSPSMEGGARRFLLVLLLLMLRERPDS